MPDFKLTDVDSKQIDNASTGIDEHIEEMQAVYEVLHNNVMQNLEPCWDGQAKRNFHQQFIIFVSMYASLLKGYKDLNEQLKKASKTYAKADDSVKQLIAKLPK